MKADVIHDYEEIPEEEIQASEEAVKDNQDLHLVETVRKEKIVGGRKLYLGIVLYEDWSDE